MGLRDNLPPLYREATTLDDAGEDEAAAEYYALRAFAGLIEAGFEPGRSLRVAVAHMLVAISADVRAGNDQRAARLFDVIRPVWPRLGTGVDDSILDGLLAEWYGDALLMLDDVEAATYYQRAADEYRRLPSPGQSPWGFEEEFDYAFWAIAAFTEATDRLLPDEAEYDFHARIRFKLALADELGP